MGFSYPPQGPCLTDLLTHHKVPVSRDLPTHHKVPVSWNLPALCKVPALQNFPALTRERLRKQGDKKAGNSHTNLFFLMFPTYHLALVLHDVSHDYHTYLFHWVPCS